MKSSFLHSRHLHNFFKHPHFGHTITNDSYVSPIRFPPGPVIRIQANMTKVYTDAETMEAMHHDLFVMIKQMISMKGSDQTVVDMEKEHFVATRYGDHLGLNAPIQGLEAGQPIDLQGEHIDQNPAYIFSDNREGDPCIHFTRRPVGFRFYQGNEYE